MINSILSPFHLLANLIIMRRFYHISFNNRTRSFSFFLLFAILLFWGDVLFLYTWTYSFTDRYCRFSNRFLSSSQHDNIPHLHFSDYITMLIDANSMNGDVLLESVICKRGRITRLWFKRWTDRLSVIWRRVLLTSAGYIYSCKVNQHPVGTQPMKQLYSITPDTKLSYSIE